MFTFSSPFRSISVPTSTQIIFVSDLFVEDYVGGAELTTQALIDSSPYKIHKVKSSDLTTELIDKNTDKFWIFGNYSAIPAHLLERSIFKLHYAVLEYDYKYCTYRSPEKHRHEQGSCECARTQHGQRISQFLATAKTVFWMSEKQKLRHHVLFPNVASNDNVVLSSVFDKKTLSKLTDLRSKRLNQPTPQHWIVLGSNSWVKGADRAKEFCVTNNLQYKVVWNLSYDKLLEELAQAKGLVYLPVGADTCPRLVIEAKLLGLDLELNEYVQHKDEPWFESIDTIENYLSKSPQKFWTQIGSIMTSKIEISGYTTVYNAQSQGYPYVETVKSLLNFCDEVIVVDGGSTDETLDELRKIEDSKLKIVVNPCDWSHPRSALFDGTQKALARSLCTKEFCWQMDCDEIVDRSDSQKIRDMCKVMTKDVMLISLPVIEYWGGSEKVRVDVTPWKWRLSRNSPDITHGVPKDLRRCDENGEMYAAQGTDGCDIIFKSSGDRVPHVSFYTPEVDNVRKMALMGNHEALVAYQSWFSQIVVGLPTVFHYSWFDIERKIKLYKNFWTRHWEVLYGKTYVDNAESNMMFDVPWSEVTDEMIKIRAKEFAEGCGGWIFHSKWKGQKTPHITVTRSEPIKFDKKVNP